MCKGSLGKSNKSSKATWYVCNTAIILQTLQEEVHFLTAKVSFIRTLLHISNYTSESLVTRLYSIDQLYIHIKTNVGFKFSWQ